MRVLSILLFVLAGISNVSVAQILNPVKWKTDFKQVNDSEFDLIYTAKIDDGWAIYSQYLESDDGPIATSFEYDAGNHYTLIGKNEESGNRKESYDKVFEMNLIKFKKTAIFTQRVKVSDISAPVTGYLTFMTCDDTRCLPPTDVDFEFKLRKTSSGTDTGSAETPDKASETTADAGNTTQNEAKPDRQPEKTNAMEEIPKTETPAFAQAETKEAASTADEQTYGQGGGIEDPVQWSVLINKKNEGNYEIVTKADIEDGWYVYSQFLEVEEGEGPIPTSFNYEEGPQFKLIDKNVESGNIKKGYDKFFDMEISKFSKEAIFTQQVEVSDPNKPFHGYMEFMTCDDTKCLPPAVLDIFIDPAGMQAHIGDVATTRIDAMNATAGKPRVVIEGNEIDQVIPSLKTSYVDPLGDCGEEDVATGQNLFWTFILGFIGGLIALLTPCVFPMIPLTVSFFTKGSKDRATGIRNGITYGLAIIVIYVALGLLITAVFGATALNELSTNAIANTLFFVIFIVFAISFFGYFEITLPSSWANKSDRMADQGGLLGIFFMAGTLAIVSFSCTGPIIGSAIVESAKSAMGPFIVMLGFSTALALPFGLFAAFPAWLNSLPRSGSWMNSVKVVLGFLELALAFKFLSVADMTYHWNILGYEIFMGLWILIFGGLTLYLFGFIKFPHDSPLKKLSPTRWSFALLFLAATVYLCTGFRYNEKTESYHSLSLLSGLAPPAHYNYLLPEPQVDPEIKAKYSSFTKCANNINCFKDYYQGLEYAREIKKPILVDFTGLACVNCRKTEEHIWIADKIWNKLNTDFVLISLYVDDRKKLEKTLLSKNTQEKIRNIGNKWADFQIVNFNQNSQPLYVMVTPDEKVLAKPRGYKEGINSYDEFLECGLATYRNYNNTLGLNDD